MTTTVPLGNKLTITRALSDILAPYSCRGRLHFALATRSRNAARDGKAPLFALWPR